MNESGKLEQPSRMVRRQQAPASETDDNQAATTLDEQPANLVRSFESGENGLNNLRNAPATVRRSFVEAYGQQHGNARMGQLARQINPSATLHRAPAATKEEGTSVPGHEKPTGSQDTSIAATQELEGDPYYEQMAVDYGYRALAVGVQIPGQKGGPKYQVIGVIDDPQTGFQAFAAVPAGPCQFPPIVVFRGTEPERELYKDLVVADTDPRGVGFNQYYGRGADGQLNSQKVAGLFAQLAGQTAKPVICGHSLGGALAQYCAIEEAGKFSKLVTFNSPGISKEMYNRYQDKTKDVAAKDRPEMEAYAHELDIVSLAGEKLLADKVNVIKNDKPPTFWDKLNLKQRFLKYHTSTYLQDPGVEEKAKANQVDFNERQQEGGFIGQHAESYRAKAGKFGRDVVDGYDKYIKPGVDVVSSGVKKVEDWLGISKYLK